MVRTRKAANMDDLIKAGMAFVFIGAVVGIGIYVNTEFGKQTFGTTTNESVNFAANDTYYWLNFRSNGISQIANYTDVFPSGTGTGNSVEANYSSRDIGQATQVRIYTNATYGTGTYNVTYAAQSEEGALALTNATESMYTIASWLPIIAVVVAAAVVIGILLLYLMFRRR